LAKKTEDLANTSKACINGRDIQDECSHGEPIEVVRVYTKV